MEESIEDIYMVGYDEQKEVIKKLMSNKVEVDLLDIVEKCPLIPFWCAMWVGRPNPLAFGRVMGNKSSITPVAWFIKKHVTE